LRVEADGEKRKRDLLLKLLEFRIGVSYSLALARHQVEDARERHMHHRVMVEE
jgi:hypothetical protein